MIITELLIPGGGTSTRSKLNPLLILPFILLVFYVLSISCLHTLLSLYFAPILSNGWGMSPMREGAIYK